MSEKTGYIVCPHCEESFHVEELLMHKYEEKYQQEKSRFEKELVLKFNKKQNQLKDREIEFEGKRKKENELFQRRIEEEKHKISRELELAIKSKYKKQVDVQIQELDQMTAEINQLKDKEIELQQVKRKMDLQQKEFEFEFEKKLLDSQRNIEETISRRIHQEMELKLLEKDKKLSDQRKMISEMQRKADQGSMQLQGEIQEIAIEEWLKRNFPMDVIDEIGKGSRGADCKQLVNSKINQGCGIIYYESKRTKEFQNAWIDKFKQDMILHNADIGVIVTQALPKGMKRMGQRSGVWICSFEEFKSLSFILRQMLLKVNEVSDQEKNKGEKMSLLYKYLTSNEFKMKIESIVDGFTQMQTDIQKEKNAMSRIWSQREKQIQKVLINTTEMYGDIKGIAGNEIPNVRQLELPIHDDEVFDLKDETVKSGI